MKDRFDLENEINELYFYANQIGSISESIMEDDLDKDTIINALDGIKILLEIHTKKLFDTMCQSFRLDNYNYKEHI